MITLSEMSGDQAYRSAQAFCAATFPIKANDYTSKWIHLYFSERGAIEYYA